MRSKGKKDEWEKEDEQKKEEENKEGEEEAYKAEMFA